MSVITIIIKVRADLACRLEQESELLHYEVNHEWMVVREWAAGGMTRRIRYVTEVRRYSSIPLGLFLNELLPNLQKIEFYKETVQKSEHYTLHLSLRSRVSRIPEYWPIIFNKDVYSTTFTLLLNIIKKKTIYIDILYINVKREEWRDKEKKKGKKGNKVSCTSVTIQSTLNPL